MAAKALTEEQARMFHLAQTGGQRCFNGCCLHVAIERAEEAERDLAQALERESRLQFAIAEAGLDLGEPWEANAIVDA